MEEEIILIATTSQGMNGTMRCWAGKEGFPPRAFGGQCGPNNTLISDLLQNCKKYISVV